MKMLYVSGSSIPSNNANTVHAMKICEAFTKLGIQTTLMCHGSGDMEKAWGKYSIEERFNIIRFPLQISGPFSLLLNTVLSTIQAVFWGLKKHVVYSRDILVCYIMSFLYVRYFVEIHLFKHKPRLYYLVLKKVLHSKLCLKIIVISEELKSDIVREYALNKDKIVIMPDSASINKYAFNSELNENNITYTGSLYEGKGVDLVIEIAKEMPDVTFNIYGGPDMIWGKKFKNTASDNVKYHGWRDQDHIQKAQSSSLFLLLPNQPYVFVNNDKDNIGRYTSPLKLFEYMSSGRPIIASDLNIFKGILNQQNSILVSHNKADQWINVIRKYKNATHNIDRIRFNAFDDFRKNFTWDIRAEKIVRIIKDRIEGQ